MSGLTGPTGGGGARLSQLNSLVKEDASAFVAEGNKLVSSAGMAFKSGLRRLFGAEKSTEDVTANKQALTLVLGHVRDSLATAAGSNGDAIYARVLHGKTQLPGDDRPISVAERFARGTYVSSELIRQISSIAHKELEASRVVERQKADNFAKYGPLNKAVVQQFFGHEPDLEDVGFLDTAKIKLSQFATRMMGDTKPGFMQAIEELVNEGSADYPPDMKPAWDAFEGFWLRGENEAPGARDKILARLERGVRVAAANCAAKGETVDADKLKAFIKKELTSLLNFPQFVDLANTRKVQSMTVADLADAVRLWGRLNKDPDITQQDCDWLAYELEEASEANRLIALPENTSLASQIRKMFTGSSYSKDRDPFAVADKLLTELQENHEKITAPLGLSGHARFQYLKQRHDDGMELYRATLKPQLYSRGDIASLIGSSMKPLLLEHRAQMDKLNSVQNAERGRKEDALNRVLDPFFVLTMEKSKIKTEAYDKLGQPTTASDFIKSVMLDSVTGAAMKQATEEMNEHFGVTDENRNKIADSTEYLAKLRETQQAVVFNIETAERSILDQLLPVVDDYTKFYEEIEALRAQPGGIQGADPQVLLALDLKARDLRERAAPLSQHAVDLHRKFAHENMGPIREFAHAMQSAAVVITGGTNTYMRNAGSEQRLFTHDLDVMNKEVQEISQRMLASLDELKRLAEAPVLPWATTELQARLKSLPELEEHVATLNPTSDPLLGTATSLGDLMIPLLARPLMSTLFGTEMEKALSTGLAPDQARTMAGDRAAVVETRLEQLLGPSIRDIDAYFEMRADLDTLLKPNADGLVQEDAWQTVQDITQQAREAAGKLRTGLDTLQELVDVGPGPIPALLREVATRIEDQTTALLESMPPSTNPFDDVPRGSPTVTVRQTPPPSNAPTQPQQTTGAIPPTQTQTPYNPFDGMLSTPPQQTTGGTMPTPTQPRSVNNPFDDR